MTSIPQRLLGEGLLISARINPHKTAIIVRGVEYSYSMLQKSAEVFANHLVGADLHKGDRVAIFMHNSWQCIVSIYGVTLAGGVFLVINSQTKADKLQYILNDCSATFLVSESALWNVYSKALQAAETVKELIVAGRQGREFPTIQLATVDFDSVISGKADPDELPIIIPNDLAALIYTSGSTGFPKGVMMTHQSMVFTSWSLIEYLRLADRDRIMLILPLAFDYGLYQLLMSVTVGGTLIVEHSFTFPASIYKSIEQLKPTVFPGVPTVYAMMIASNKGSGLTFGGIEKVTNTAAALPVKFIPDLKKIFPNALIFSMYGLTECKRVSYLEPELIDTKPGSVGKAIPGTEVFLLSQEGLPAPPGQPGILHVRGPHVMLGYWNREDLSNEMLRPGNLPGERILCSNDWFTMDTEGFLYFQGRMDDIIKSRGEKVSPLEVENVIYQIEGIKETVVFGVPDEILGEAIYAFVTVHSNAVLTEKDILKECTSHLELFMIPRKILFLDEMPKSDNGKIDRKELKQRFISIHDEF